jgi:hypothetical protein
MGITVGPKVFISYSHRGNGPQRKAALLRVLHVFEQHHLLDVWQDGKIRVSSYWEPPFDFQSQSILPYNDDVIDLRRRLQDTIAGLTMKQTGTAPL